MAGTVFCTRERPRLEGSLETKDQELVEKFVMFQLFYTLCRTNNKVRMYMCVYAYVYIDGIYMMYLCVDIICVYICTHTYTYICLYIYILISCHLFP